jgi:putative endonuclease
MDKIQQGERAESLALSWLETHGYQCVGRNFRCRLGEIDLIVREPDNACIVFVEVRYRRALHYGGGVASVDARKQQKLIRTANAWLQRYACSHTPARIDVIAISPASASTPCDRYWAGHDITWIINAVEA